MTEHACMQACRSLTAAPTHGESPYGGREPEAGAAADHLGHSPPLKACLPLTLGGEWGESLQAFLLFGCLHLVLAMEELPVLHSNPQLRTETCGAFPETILEPRGGSKAVRDQEGLRPAPRKTQEVDHKQRRTPKA